MYSSSLYSSHLFLISSASVRSITFLSKRDTDVQNSLLDSVGEGDGGMISENGIETCIISYKK